MHEPILTRALHGGTQKLYRFPNDYGASVVQHSFSHGNSEGLWELAVVHFANENLSSYELDYTTSVTDDVIGNCDEAQIHYLLEHIEQLPPAFLPQ
jgi:hypothetical protein